MNKQETIIDIINQVKQKSSNALELHRVKVNVPDYTLSNTGDFVQNSNNRILISYHDFIQQKMNELLLLIELQAKEEILENERVTNYLIRSHRKKSAYWGNILKDIDTNKNNRQKMLSESPNPFDLD